MPVKATIHFFPIDDWQNRGMLFIGARRSGGRACWRLYFDHVFLRKGKDGFADGIGFIYNVPLSASSGLRTSIINL